MGAQELADTSLDWDDPEIAETRDLTSRRNRRMCRRHRGPRATVEVLHDGEPVPFECFDLSAVGLYLHADLLFDLGESVELRIELPDQPRAIEARGIVVRAQTNDDGMGAGMGVAFHRISLQDQARLDRYLMRRFLGHG